MDDARITADERAAELVRRNWYPDVTLGVSVFDEDGGNDREFGGYEAMVSFAVPLQWGLRRAREGEAVRRGSPRRGRAARRRPGSAEPARRRVLGPGLGPAR